MKTQIINETIEVNENGDYLIEADPSIIADFKAKLNPVMNKKFSYKDGDHLKDAVANEKKMRENR